MWARDVIAYSQAFRTYAVDLLGEAGRSVSSRPSWNGSAYTEWLDDVLSASKVERAVLITMSQGALVNALKPCPILPSNVNTCPELQALAEMCLGW
jgi:pimeloyl-ACP methyl ester carboxylesterase